jgi:hypothetical protein
VNRFEFLDRRFRLRPNVEIPPGVYRENRATVGLDTFRRRHRTLNVTYSSGDFWGGDRDTLSLRTSYRVSTNVGLSGNYDVNWVDLPQGSFTTQLFSGRVQLAFRNDLALLSLFQYNSDSRQLSTNLRFNWIPKPGADFFIVYNELDDSTAGLAVRNRSIVVKLNYLLAI